LCGCSILNRRALSPVARSDDRDALGGTARLPTVGDFVPGFEASAQFEPVPDTFAKLTESIQRLGLNDSVHPIPAAVVDNPGPVQISYSVRNSLLAQVSPCGLNPRVGDKLVQAKGITLDGFCSSVRALPQLVKIEVEGSEVAALRGARGLLSRPDRPAILFEYNPFTLRESGSSVHALLDLLPGYRLH
jgi:FkbM family methyltransferase